MKFKHFDKFKESNQTYVDLGREAEDMGWLEDTDKDVRPYSDFHQFIQFTLGKAHIFNLDKEVTELLLETKNRIKYEKPPFPATFLDTEVKVEEGIYLRGILIVDMGGFDVELESPEYLSVFGYLYGNNLSIKHLPNMEMPTEPVKKHGQMLVKKHGLMTGTTIGAETEPNRIGADIGTEKMKKTVVNFLDFIHNPDVEWVEKKGRPSPKEGKGFSECPVCGKHLANREAVNKHIQDEHPELEKPVRTVSLSGKTKQYVQRYKNMSKKERKKVRTHWVRGHYRHLKSDYYTNKQGQKIWIPPHLRGRGKIVPKSYSLKE